MLAYGTAFGQSKKRKEDKHITDSNIGLRKIHFETHKKEAKEEEGKRQENSK